MEPGIVFVLPPCYLGQSGSYQIAAKGDKPIEHSAGRSPEANPKSHFGAEDQLAVLRPCHPIEIDAKNPGPPVRERFENVQVRVLGSDRARGTGLGWALNLPCRIAAAGGHGAPFCSVIEEADGATKIKIRETVLSPAIRKKLCSPSVS